MYERFPVAAAILYLKLIHGKISKQTTRPPLPASLSRQHFCYMNIYAHNDVYRLQGKSKKINSAAHAVKHFVRIEFALIYV